MLSAYVSAISVTKHKTKLNCFRKSYKIFWRACKNEPKTAYEHAISCVHKFSQTVAQVFMSIDKLE